MRRRGDRGFTLIELVLALTIVALMLTILFSSLRVGLRAWQRGEERAEALQYSRSMSQLVELALGGAYPLQGRIDKDKPVQILPAKTTNPSSQKNRAGKLSVDDF